MADYSSSSGGGRRSSNTLLLQELEALSETLYQPPPQHTSTTTTTTRRTASLVLPRNSVPTVESLTGSKNADDSDTIIVNPKPRSRRMSLSPWRSRPKLDIESVDNIQQQSISSSSSKFVKKSDSKVAETTSSEKKGLWNWKPIRALAHIGKQKLSCLFSVEVVTVQGLPTSMNGLRLSVCVRKKETKDGAVQTMPSRVSQGAADFEETLFVRCHVYYTPNSSTGGARFKFEPRPFVIYAFAVDAEELDFGRNMVDLSEMIEESIQKNFEGNRIRQWDMSYNLSGKAKGGELVLKLGFQIMEKDGGVGIYSQADQGGTKNAKSYSSSSSSSFARKQSKSSFSVPSPRMSSLSSANWSTPSQTGTNANLQGIDELNLDDEPVKEEPKSKGEDLDLPDFDVVDKGIEMQEDKGVETGDKDEATKEVEEDQEGEDERSEGTSDKRSVSSSQEVVKEVVVHDQMHLTRLSALDSIAQQIKALESMFRDENQVKTEEEEEDSESQKLDADEETVTREFLQMLEDPGVNQSKTDNQRKERGGGGDEENEKRKSGIFVPDLAKGLGCVVQTRNGGFLAAMNPLNTAVLRKDTPKLAMQMSKPFVLPSIPSSVNGFELFQKMAAVGLEEFTSKILSMMPMEELVGKTAEQIAFEGIASAIIQGRNKEGGGGASSTAAETVAAVKSMAAAMNTSRNERISTGIWNISDKPLTVDEILAFTLQKMEAMTVEALKIQADIAEEEAPFDISANKKDDDGHLLDSAVPLEDWNKDDKSDSIMIFVVIQLRDPLRQFEAVGGPMIALVQAVRIDEETKNFDDEENRFKVACLAIGGLKIRSGGQKNAWDTEKQKLTAMQWLVAYGLGKMAKKVKKASPHKGQDLLWSIAARIMADMWLKSIRNPDIKFIA